MIGHTKPDGDVISFLHKPPDHFDLQGPIPGSDVPLRIKTAFQDGIVRSLDFRESRTLRVLELKIALISGKTEDNPQAATVIDAETSADLGQRKALVTSCLEISLPVQEGLSKEFRRDRFAQGPVVHEWL